MRALRLISALIALLMAPPAVAQQAGNAPPGNSAVDQYQEAVPVATGKRPSRSATTADEGTPVLDEQTVAALEQRGTVGEQLLALTEATGSPVPNSRGKGEEARPDTPGVRAREPSLGIEEGSSAITSVALRSIVGADGAGGGMGLVLPVLLIAVAAAGIGHSLRRRPDPA